MKTFLLSILLLSLSTAVRAELMGFVPGRGANLAKQASLSVETGASWYTSQLRWSGVRLNLKPANHFLAYIDYANIRASDLPLGNANRADFAGAGFGGGVMLTLPDRFTAFDVAFKAAYHAAVIDRRREKNIHSGVGSLLASEPVAQALQTAQWSAEFIVSPIDPFLENGLTWYSTLGFVSTNAMTKSSAGQMNVAEHSEYRQKSGAAVGFGWLVPLARGRLYGGFSWLSGDPLFGVGFRHAFR